MGPSRYVHARRNIALLGAFRGDVRLTFFHAALLEDPEGLLERQGAQGVLRVRARADAIQAFLARPWPMPRRGSCRTSRPG
jgi:uncharacterized protein YdeI (YjbR/CyaY-like superfamily)